MALPSVRLDAMVATVSTWPCRKCPPRRVPGRRARSRLRREVLVRLPRLVRRSVSGAMPTLKVVEEGSSVIVRQVPGRGKERVSGCWWDGLFGRV